MKLSTRISAAAVLVCLAATGCGAGLTDGTDSERTTPYAANANAGTIKVRDVSVIPNADGTATLAANFVNDGTTADAFVGATTPIGSVSAVGGQVSDFTLPPTVLVSFGAATAGDTTASLQITGLSQPLVFGTTVPVTLSFQNAGQVTLDAPVQPATGA